ncbi:MAG: ornithine cyclodeaminase family protein [Peptoniphilus sp.]|uniref:ornithine cyclodeaminase family protein n=1 Tax=Peptoniphilus sp. TaxID=1971214 RepID=UPI0025E16462|nr:ornithine cyclodeaminase family protein [Peptoniphilus sp.]MCI5643548.1 ornithine cyclodeaminase family protein [Peptoniphilus sp.]MDY3902230.1 ornithine cyclodeaminase family protein [Peptoniphilus sp.]
MEILILKERDILEAVNIKDIIEADKEALKNYSEGKCDIPLRTVIDVDKKSSSTAIFMPGYVEDKDALGMKIIDIYPQNIEKGLVTSPSTMILINKENGFVKAILDGTILTRLRTGAVSGAATEILSNKYASKFLLIGTGGQAETQLEAVLAVRPIEKAYVYDLNFERAKEFAKNMEKKLRDYGAKIIAIEKTEEVIEDVDVITTVTTSKKPVFDGKKVKKGVHVNGVGSYTPDMQEIPEDFLIRADKIFTDTKEGVLKESGDVIIPIKSGILKREKVSHELGNLILGREIGRTSENEITWFKTVGFAGLDLVAAEKIYELAIEKNIGTKIEM